MPLLHHRKGVVMIRAERSIHTREGFHSQHLAQTALAYQAHILQLVSRLMEKDQSPDVLHALRTHCRRLQAILQLFGDERHARLLARRVQRLSKLRAMHVFKQYLTTISAPLQDMARVKMRIQTQRHKIEQARAYDALAQVVMAHAIPPTLSEQALLEQRETVRQDHLRRVRRLIEAAQDSPKRKRLHALRLEIKTIRYQLECCAREENQPNRLLRKMIRLQGLLGRYEELADFRRWGRRLSGAVQDQIKRDWKKSRKRARAVPDHLSWLLRALGSRDLWLPCGQ